MSNIIRSTNCVTCRRFQPFTLQVGAVLPDLEHIKLYSNHIDIAMGLQYLMLYKILLKCSTVVDKHGIMSCNACPFST